MFVINRIKKYLLSLIRVVFQVVFLLHMCINYHEGICESGNKYMYINYNNSLKHVYILLE